MKMRPELLVTMFIFSVVSSGMAYSQEIIAGGYLSPKICQDSVLYTVQPIWPRHVEFSAGGCSVSVAIRVNPDGSVSGTDKWNSITTGDLRNFATIKPENCSNRYIKALTKTLGKAKFVASESGLNCTYTYNFVLES